MATSAAGIRFLISQESMVNCKTLLSHNQDVHDASGVQYPERVLDLLNYLLHRFVLLVRLSAIPHPAQLQCPVFRSVVSQQVAEKCFLCVKAIFSLIKDDRRRTIQYLVSDLFTSMS